MERASKTTLEDFMRDERLRNDTRRAIAELLNELYLLGSRVADGNDEDLIWNLAKSGLIQAPLAQELVDVISLYRSGSDELIYASLVRIMEDIEEAYHTLKARLEGS
ncbi:hypothetical protein HA72_0736 [Metallosphaera sedula]|uniref:PaREP1 domain containing protein n=2 Tax=Metallosphaera sedula TaxID=43687 RepID=A4YEQ9_METS5|nr:hypothetical protein Msed_0736 [Metallosphaera sedula DSM 5348]AIM26898.1 hypothetical protein HA72_0736 [Metallosphaera sedula]AKV75284.1 hypothetical protein MsedA_0751 [Metallosphaera sedula]AKV77523.1 hypothetical protein MsedB_0751 [Metallosphaera sedula]AKV79770.1 hypothetical protein MsedC_0750 [Metallosphaera sedula]